MTQLVAAAVPVRVLQATLAQLDGSVHAAGRRAGRCLARRDGTRRRKRGGLDVAVQPKLSGALPGMRRFFETYPFICLEQKTSKAVGLKDAQALGRRRQRAADLPRQRRPRQLLPAARRRRAARQRSPHRLPARGDARGRLRAARRRRATRCSPASTAFVEGRIERKFWSPRPDLDVRKLAAIEALSRYGRAQAKMLGSINLDAEHLADGGGDRLAQHPARVDGIPDARKRLDEAQQILRGRLTYAGTTLRFSTEESDFWWWLMDSADANAARLILAVLDDPALEGRAAAHGRRQPRAASAAAPGSRRPPTCGARSRSTSSRRSSSRQTVAGATTAARSTCRRRAAAASSRADVADWGTRPAAARSTLPWPDRRGHAQRRRRKAAASPGSRCRAWPRSR